MHNVLEFLLNYLFLEDGDGGTADTWLGCSRGGGHVWEAPGGFLLMVPGCGIYGSCKLMIMKLDVVTLTGPLATRYSMGTLALTRAWPFNATASVSLNVTQLVLSYPGNTLLTT